MDADGLLNVDPAWFFDAEPVDPADPAAAWWLYSLYERARFATLDPASGVVMPVPVPAQWPVDVEVQPDGTAWVVDRRGEELVVLQGTATGPWSEVAGPVPGLAHGVAAGAGDLRARLDAEGLWWFDGREWARVAYTTDSAPAWWAELPPVVGCAADQLAVVGAEHVVAVGMDGVCRWRVAGGPFTEQVLVGRRGHRHPADGATADTSLEFPTGVWAAPGGVWIWERGGQRLLRMTDPLGPTPAIHTVWRRDPAPDGPASEAPAAPPLPPTFEQAVETFTQGAWVDWDGSPMAWVAIHYAAELRALGGRRADAIAALSAARTGGAAVALALLRADEADAWLREALLDPEVYGWESGATCPKAQVAARALEFLHGRPLREVVHLDPRTVSRLRRTARAGDGWGPDVHARFLLGELGYDAE